MRNATNTLVTQVPRIIQGVRLMELGAGKRKADGVDQTAAAAVAAAAAAGRYGAPAGGVSG